MRYLVGFLTLLILNVPQTLNAQTSAFNYQGKLTESDNPASGAFQMQFKLFDALANGNQIGSTINDVPVTVSQGVFSVKLDFGTVALSGANRWIEIAIRHNSGESYTTLAPREQIASSPYAVRTLSAATADVATNATQLGGVPASQYVQANSNGTVGAVPLWSSGNALSNSAITQNSSGNISLNPSAAPVFLTKFQANGDNDQAGVAGISNTGIGVYGSSNSQFGVMGFSPAGVGVRGAVNVGIGVQAAAPNQGSIALRADGSSWFRGDTTALSSSQTGPGEGIVIGSVGGYGYIAAWDYGVFQSRNLVLNRDGGNVGINTNAPTLPLDVNGRARIRSIPNLGGTTGAVCFNPLGDLLLCGGSSLKWKYNVRTFGRGLDVISRLRPISYNWKQNGQADVGLGAEDVARIAPEITFFNTKGEAEGVKYEKINLLLINAINEQQTMIERQNRRIDELAKLVCRSKRRAKICAKEK